MPRHPGKPVMFTEFGADAIAGTHPWAFADFHASQSIHRMATINFTRVFTRDGQPKLAAHRLKELWKAPK